METLIWLIVGWSITSILVNGTILDPVRNYFIVKLPFFSKLLTCIQCSGFWVGIFLGLLSLSGLTVDLLKFHFIHIGLAGIVAKIIAYGFLNSGVSVILDSLIVYFIKNEKQ